MSLSGCDVASYQGTVDFDALRQETSFLIAKCSEGTGYRDPTFNRNWTEAKRVGLIRGAYHFARADLGLAAEAEATYFLSNLGPVNADDVLALDYEVRWDGDVVAWCKAFLDKVKEATGITAFIYLNRSYFGLDWSPVIDAGYPLWLADYDGIPDSVRPTPWPDVAMKQWTSSGRLNGIPARVDLNTWFKEDTVPSQEQWEAHLADDASTADTIKKAFWAHLDDDKNTADAIKAVLKRLAEGHEVQQHEIDAINTTLGPEGVKLILQTQLGVRDEALKPKALGDTPGPG